MNDVAATTADNQWGLFQTCFFQVTHIASNPALPARFATIVAMTVAMAGSHANVATKVPART